MLQGLPQRDTSAQGGADEAIAQQAKGLSERDDGVRQLTCRLRPLVNRVAETGHLDSDHAVLLRKQGVCARELEATGAVDAHDRFAGAGMEVTDTEAVRIGEGLTKSLFLDGPSHSLVLSAAIVRGL